jgi:hypothetical protein
MRKTLDLPEELINEAMKATTSRLNKSNYHCPRRAYQKIKNFRD